MLRKVRKIFNITIWAVVGVYLLVVVLLNIPTMQTYVGERVSAALGEKIGSNVTIGRVDLGLMNRIIIDNVSILDQSRRQMFGAQRLSAKVRMRDLVRGKITISSAQIFSLKADLYKKEEAKDTNFQFLLNAFKSDNDSKSNPIDLKINSLIIRRSDIVYNDWSEVYEGVISPKHVNINGLSAHIIANKISDDSLNVHIRRLSLQDKSGLDIKKLSLKLIAGRTRATLFDFDLQLPTSQLQINATAEYTLKTDTTTHIENLKYSGRIDNSLLLLSELHVSTAQMDLPSKPITLFSTFEGDTNSIRIRRLELMQGDDFHLNTLAEATRRDSLWSWKANIEELKTNTEGVKNVINSVGIDISLPTFAEQLERIYLAGEASGEGNDISLTGRVATNLGDVSLQIDKIDNTIKGYTTVDSLNLAILTNCSDLGSCNFSIDFAADVVEKKLLLCQATTNIQTLKFRGHNYQNVTLQADYNRAKALLLTADVSDDYGDVNLSINCSNLLETHLTSENLSSKNIKIPTTTCQLSVHNLQPAALNLTDRWKDSAFSFSLDGTFAGSGIENIVGELCVNDFSQISTEEHYNFQKLMLSIESNANGEKNITCKSDFASILMEGKFQYATMYDSFKSTLTTHIPSLPIGISYAKPNNQFDIYATITNSDFAEHILGIPLHLDEPAHIIAKVDDIDHTISVNADAQNFAYGDQRYTDNYLIINSVTDTMRVKANAMSIDHNGNTMQLTISAKAFDNQLASSLFFDSHARNHITGSLNSQTNFNSKSPEGKPAFEIDVLPSSVLVADTTWTINPSHLTYYANYLKVDNFSIRHNQQFININGVAQKNTTNDILVSTKDVNVAYILDFVNFDAVEFNGYATGEAKLTSLFDSPNIMADMEVTQFRFEGGAMGTTHIYIGYDFAVGSITIDAVCREDAWVETDVNGYVSLKNKNIDMTIKAVGSNIDFIEKYCDMFAHVPKARGWGEINIVGPLKELQIMGSARVTGDITIDATQVTYHLDKQLVNFVEDDIVFANDTIIDNRGNKGILTGHLPHHHLGNISYDLLVTATNLLALDLKEFGEDPYLGTVYATGTCRVAEVQGGTLITIDVTPEEGSFLTYDATAPDRVSDSFIHWNDISEKGKNYDSKTDNDISDEERNMLADININFLLRCRDNSELRILMDSRTGDIITLNGSGVITATYYNKGDFEIFGNYEVEHGTYRVTIQDVIQRDFTFKEGGTISFAGDPMEAQLNMQANYTLNSVPLSDINIGNMFTNNNVRVDCIMNITGTPDNPQIDFSLDMPTIGSDAKQMVMSMFNDTEELNQQVVYLIAVGRFLNQGTNNSSTQARYSQTSLAMQSILSGTVSQQINSLLENVIGSKQWDFGANISPGEEGFNDAEYEGLVSGRMFNSRLLFNGQFGYRDNPNATSSFIGDFDLRYLIVPTGSMAVRIYNETNNRYFTKNTLNTQGVSLIIKKDFSSWHDFFRRKKKTKVQEIPSDTLSTNT